MFDPDHGPRVFAMPPGVDFPAALVAGLVDRTKASSADALARCHLIVNTRRMARRIRDLFDQGPARLLPRISLISDLGDRADLANLPPAVPALRRRLELVQLIASLLDQQPDLAARASLFDLADSLAALMEEMQGEGVSADAIRGLDVSDQSGHWARAQAFFGIAEQFLAADGDAPDAALRQRLMVEHMTEEWKKAPPHHPVILAGSTGSRGTTMMLMQAIARLPQGAIVLPGFDFDQTEKAWDQLRDAMTSEDHPQYRYRKLMDALGIAATDVRRWTDDVPPAPGRNRVVSLALRPAPFTDAWLNEGPDLPDLPDAMNDVTLLEAPTPRAEALALALRLRHAAETGQTAALITPDRMLTRQVSAALDGWNILPDDSAGLPLHLSPPGRFLRHVAGLFVHRLTGESLLTLLKHPLCHDGGDRNLHLLQTRDLELNLRRNGPPFPDYASLTAYAARDQVPQEWLDWLVAGFCGHAEDAPRPLRDWVKKLRDLAEQIAAGSAATGSGTLWDKNAGQSALGVISELEKEAASGGTLSARDFGDLLGSLLSQQEVRDRDAPHASIMIWGTLEARVQGADLVLLGGLNEGSWPEAMRPDPWLNRNMRAAAGLLLPDRRIGLSAHDFQQAVAGREVWLSRAVRSDEAETVASRWLNRLTNLIAGLPVRNGPAALEQMRNRGALWLDWSEQLEHAPHADPAPRPSPRPPADARPRKLSVTEIKRLIRDPYAIYARHVLRVRPLDPLTQEPDALLRGTIVHKVLEDFIRHSITDPDILSRDALMTIAARVLADEIPWPTARHLWHARVGRFADWFIASEKRRRASGKPVKLEARTRITLSEPNFELTGTADRVDRNDDGTLLIYDYKTGAAPSAAQQAKFDKQLLLEAAMAERGGFEGIGPAPVRDAVFIGLGSTPKEVSAPLGDEPPDKVLADFRDLIAAYLDSSQGFTSRRALHLDTDIGDYDHLARFGEWDRAITPTPEDLT